jgi:hypothetical protein
MAHFVYIIYSKTGIVSTLEKLSMYRNEFAICRISERRGVKSECSSLLLFEF